MEGQPVIVVGVVFTSLLSSNSPSGHLGRASNLLPSLASGGPSPLELLGPARRGVLAPTLPAKDSKDPALLHTVTNLERFLSIACPLTFHLWTLQVVHSLATWLIHHQD